MQFSIFEEATGKILMAMDVPTVEDAIDNLQPGQLLIEGWFDGATHYVPGGTLKYYPPRPGPWCEFNYATEQWFDPRTMAEYDAYVQAMREAAKAPKKAILHQIADSSGLAYADIQDLAAGRLPALIVAALWQMTPLEVTKAVIDWSAATEISRLDPVVLAVQAHMGTVDWNLDVLFGIALDPPPPSV